MTPPELSEDLLSAYLDGELDPDTRAAVEARLAAAPDWRAVLEDVRAARDAVRGLPPVDLSPAAWSRVIAAVGADDAAPTLVTAWRRRARTTPARWATAGAAAAAVAAAIAIVVVPGPSRVTPKVATFTTEHSAQASLASDPVSSLAGISAMRGLGR